MTIQVETIGNATVYCGDARDIADTIPKADLIVCDPPYLLTSGGNTNTPNSMQGGWIKDFQNTGKPILCDITWPEIMAIFDQSIDQGDIYCMVNNRNIGPAWAAAKEVGLREHNTLVWDKRSATANRWYMKNLEFVWYFYKGKSVTINDPSAKQLTAYHQKDVTAHPTEKPVALMRSYIENSSQVNDVVLDPFMGSGTTGVGALQSKRKFIGIEQDQQWFDVACERLEQALNTPDMFTTLESPPIEAGIV